MSESVGSRHPSNYIKSDLSHISGGEPFRSTTSFGSSDNSLVTTGIIIGAWALMLNFYMGIALWVIVSLFDVDLYSTAGVNTRIIAAAFASVVLSGLTWGMVRSIVEA